MKKIRTHYDNLQVAENASPEVIKGAYRYLSQRWHPDKNPADREKAERITRIINQAYEVLSDPEKRRQHDAWIAEQRRVQEEDVSSPSPPPPPEASAESPSEGDFVADPPQVRPWVRYWARMVDICIFGFVAGIGLLLFFPEFMLDPDADAILGMLILFLWVFVEPLVLLAFGTTPGKWLLKTKVLSTNGSSFDYGSLLSRSAKVWWRGLGVGFPIVSLVTLIVAYSRLSSKGITSWDREGHFFVMHEKIGAARVIATIVLLLFFFAFLMGDA